MPGLSRCPIRQRMMSKRPVALLIIPALLIAGVGAVFLLPPFANLGPMNFDSATFALLKIAPYQATPINGNTIGGQLVNGSVIATRTRSGHYAKMRIDSCGYNLVITSTTVQ